ncbi:MAG: M23 family metallopeptidase [Clostridia bacterium]|nr:M23 family metallopeptidase [Clostridia bacterium]
MRKILALCRKILPQKVPSLKLSREQLRQALKGRTLYLVLLLAVLVTSIYLVSNDAVFNKHGVKTYMLDNGVNTVSPPRPEEPPAGATTVPPELEGQTGANVAPATAPAAEAAAETDNEGLPALFAPVAGEVAAGYGFTYMPAFGDYRFHPGIDFAAPVGSEVRSAAAGTVKQVEYSDEWRYRLVIDSGNGYQVVYAHLNNIRVAKGDRVERGSLLGLLGEAGSAEAGTEAHLHLELLKNGKAIDPALALQ